VSFDLRNIRQPTYRESEEPSAKRTRDGLAYARLAYARWTDKTDDLALHRTAQLANCEELKDASLDIGEAVVVCIEDALCIREGEIFGCVSTPGDLFVKSNQ
jgi:hypothetical protein